MFYILKSVVNTIESTWDTSVLPDINHEIPQYLLDCSRSTFKPSKINKEWDFPEKPVFM